jgi:nucleotide-binding universal stress UspA family protein
VTAAIERVVAPLDAASENRAAIDTAARLAARAKAPLHGIFVEDEDLLRLASLPFARQITLGAGAEPFTAEQVELHLQAAAERARRDLSAAAKRHAVDYSFEIVRGASEIVLSGVTERDLVVAGALTRPIAGDFRVECRWWSSIEVATGPFLLTRGGWDDEVGSVVMLLHDRGPASVRLLEAAAQAAEARGGALTVICPPAVVGADGFETWIAERLAGFSVRAQIEAAQAEPAALRRRIGELDCRLLAVDAGRSEGHSARLREFHESFACDILFVR